MQTISLETFLLVIEERSNGVSDGVDASTKLSALPIDSLDLFSIIGSFEDRTGKSLSDEEFEEMKTVGDFLTFFTA